MNTRRSARIAAAAPHAAVQHTPIPRHPLDSPVLFFALFVALLYAVFTYLPIEAMATHPVGQTVVFALWGFIVYTVWYIRSRR